MTEDGGAEPFIHGTASEAIADVVIEDWWETTEEQKNMDEEESSFGRETGYELLSDEDLLEQIEKGESENDKE